VSFCEESEEAGSGERESATVLTIPSSRFFSSRNPLLFAPASHVLDKADAASLLAEYSKAN